MCCPTPKQPKQFGAIYMEVHKLRDEAQEQENLIWEEFRTRRDALQAQCTHQGNTSKDTFTGDVACWDCGKWL